MYPPYVLYVGEYEGFLNVKPTGYDVLGVLEGQSVGLLHSQILPEKLLIVRHLDHKWHVKHILEVPVWVCKV